jgi:2',3'-cyclic-nucleotide 2'-phosphodiesterase (5'-nucleotidase family)
MGGFARRMSYWNAFARKYPTRPALRIDGGSIFAAGVVEAPIVNRWMLEGTYRSRLDAIHLSLDDLPVWRELADLAAAALIPKEFLQVPLVSANVTPHVPNFPKVERFIVRPVKLEGGWTLRVGITGAMFDPDDRVSSDEFTVQEPAAALSAVLASMQGAADYRVVLMDGDIGRAISTVVTVPGISVILVAHNYVALTDAQQVGETLMIIPVNEGRMINELRIGIDARTAKANVETRFVPLDKAVPDEPALGELVRKAQAELDAFLSKR